MELQDIKTDAVIGAGIMDQGLAQSCGDTTYMFGNTDKKKLAGHVAQVEANLNLFQEYDLLKEDVKITRLSLGSRFSIKEMVETADFIINLKVQ